MKFKIHLWTQIHRNNKADQRTLFVSQLGLSPSHGKGKAWGDFAQREGESSGERETLSVEGFISLLHI